MEVPAGDGVGVEITQNTNTTSEMVIYCLYTNYVNESEISEAFYMRFLLHFSCLSTYLPKQPFKHGTDIPHAIIPAH